MHLGELLGGRGYDLLPPPPQCPCGDFLSHLRRKNSPSTGLKIDNYRGSLFSNAI